MNYAIVFRLLGYILMIEGALLLFFLAMPDYLKGSVFQNLGQLF